MVTTSKTLPVTPDSKPSSWINQALHNRKLRSSVLVQGFFVGLGFLFGFWGGFRGFGLFNWFRFFVCLFVVLLTEVAVN